MLSDDTKADVSGALAASLNAQTGKNISPAMKKLLQGTNALQARVSLLFYKGWKIRMIVFDTVGFSD